MLCGMTPSICSKTGNYGSRKKALAKYLVLATPAVTIGKRNKTSQSAFVEVEGMISTAKINFESHRHNDPHETWKIFGFASVTSDLFKKRASSNLTRVTPNKASE